MSAENRDTSKMWRGVGQGKLILLGEHAVVWGTPALAAGLDQGALAQVYWAPDASHSELTLYSSDKILAQLTDRSDDPLGVALRALLETMQITEHVAAQVILQLPAGAGLGSSAALAVALARALAKMIDRADDDDLIDAAVMASETIFHHSPSGIDQTAARLGGLFCFERGEPAVITPLHVSPPQLLVCQAAPGASTARQVEAVASLRARNPEQFEHIEALITSLVSGAREALEASDWPRLGELMNLNHGALASMGVSTSALDHACHIARDAGALGAKLTGAGGGGCVIALVTDETRERVLHAWREADMTCFPAQIKTNA